jgi:general stress protein 26
MLFGVIAYMGAVLGDIKYASVHGISAMHASGHRILISPLFTLLKRFHMSTLTIAEISEKMADIDFTMLSTHTDNGDIATRPMSNNEDVEFDGDSYYFSYEQARTISDIQRNPKVSLSFQAGKSLLGKPGMMITVQGHAHLIHDKNEFEAHWSSDLDRWFKQGTDTPGMVLIKISAHRIHYWDGEDQGEVTL